MPIKVLSQFPPNIDAIKKAFDLSGDEIFCYGDIIYNPSNKDLTPDLLEHEMVHIAQQSQNTAQWWGLYLKDRIFRASQEIPAYQMQYRVAKNIIKDRNRLFLYLKQIAINLSSETYGKVMTFNEAVDAIKKEELFDISKLTKNVL